MDTKKKEKAKGFITKKTVKPKAKPVKRQKGKVKADKSVKVGPKNDRAFKKPKPKNSRKKESNKPISKREADKWLLENIFNNPLVSATPTGRGVRDMLIKDLTEKRKVNTVEESRGEVIRGNIMDVPMPSLTNNRCGTFGCVKKAMRGKAYCVECSNEMEILGHTTPKRRKNPEDFQYDREREEIEI